MGLRIRDSITYHDVVDAFLPYVNQAPTVLRSVSANAAKPTKMQRYEKEEEKQYSTLEDTVNVNSHTATAIAAADDQPKKISLPLSLS